MNTSTTRVSFEVRGLAPAFDYPPARRGIPRVIEHLARGLSADPSIDLAFCNLGEHWSTPSCRRYLAEVAGLSDVRFVGDRQAVWAGRAVRALRVDRLSGSRWRAARRLGGGLGRAVQRTYFAAAARAAAAPADVYHSAYDPLPAAVRAGRNVRTRFLTVYDLIPVRFPHWFRGTAYDFLPDAFQLILDSLRSDDFVHCISQSARSDLLEAVPRLDPRRVFVSTLAADADTFAPEPDPERIRAARRRYDISDGPYFLSVCTLDQRKNVEAAVKAFRLTADADRGTEMTLVLVGTRGQDNPALDRLLTGGDTAAGRGRVVVTGYVPDADLSPLYTGAVAFVYPSLYEGFGLPPLEAMSCGTPAITSDVSSLPEVVGDAGLMVPPHDVDALAAAMGSVLRDPGRRAELGRRALARAATFSWDRCVSRLADAYREAAGRP